MLKKKKPLSLYRCLNVLVAMAVSDLIWAKYIATVASGSALVASLLGVLVVLFGAFVVVSYVEDKRLIIPAAIGAFIGTYYGV